jgi:hypothetical protein
MTFTTKTIPRMHLNDQGQLELIAGTSIKAPAGDVLSIAGNWISGDAHGLTLRTASNGGTVGVRGSGAKGSANLDVSGNILGTGKLTINHIAASGNITSSVLASGTIEASGTITSTGLLRTRNYLQVEGYANENDSCNAAGMLGLNPVTKALVQCLNGRWLSLASHQQKLKRIRVKGAVTAAGNTTSEAYCPAGTIAVSSGYEHKQGGSYNAPSPRDSYVMDSWEHAKIRVKNPGYVAYATCLWLD